MTIEEFEELNNLPPDGPDNPSLFTFLARIIVFAESYTRTHEPTKEEVRKLAVVEFFRCRSPKVSRRTIGKLVDRYWQWHTHTYTAPEEREWQIYWKEFRHYVQKLGIPLKDFDEAGEASIYFGLSEFRNLLIGFYLIAEDRAPSFVIHGCYYEMMAKTLGILYHVTLYNSPDQPDQKIIDLLGSPNDVKMKLLNLLYCCNSDTVGQATGIIQLMLYMQDDPDRWIPYLLEVKGQEIISMLKRVLDALLEMILGKDKMPLESKLIM